MQRADDRAAFVTTALMVLALVVVVAVRTAHTAAIDVTSTAEVNAVADKDVINILAGTYTLKLVGSLEDAGMRRSPVAAGILWNAIALYLVSRFVSSR